MDEVIVPPVSSSPETLPDGDYFTLLEMFTWTRWLVEQYFYNRTKSNFSDIAVSVSESAVLAREFLVSFLAEFYLQLTTISWLSVRTVQRTNKSLSPSDEDNRAGSLLSSILSVFSSLLELFSSTGPAYQADSDWSSAPEPSVVITRAEERVRWADTRHM